MAFIDVMDVSYAYDKSEKHLALNHLSLSIARGEWVAIIGSNGSGKSTLAKTLNGLIEPDSGQVYVDGLLLNEENVWEIRNRVGMVFQNPDNQFVGATVEDDVAFGLENRGIEREEMIRRVNQSLSAVGMSDFKEREPSALSGGQKQRVAIAGVLAIQPEIIILDESTSMLDPQGRHEVLSIVRRVKEENNLTVLSITHDIDEAVQADRMIIMSDGKQIAEGTPEEIFTSGNELINLGLDMPFSESLKEELKHMGMNVSEKYQTQESLVDWLCK